MVGLDGADGTYQLTRIASAVGDDGDTIEGLDVFLEGDGHGLTSGEGCATIEVSDIAYLQFARSLVGIDGEATREIRLCAELSTLDTHAGTDDTFATGVLDVANDLSLGRGLLLGTEDADGLTIDCEDEGRTLEQAFYSLLGGHLVEGYSGFVSSRAKLWLVVDLVA